MCAIDELAKSQIRRIQSPLKTEKTEADDSLDGVFPSVKHEEDSEYEMSDALRDAIHILLPQATATEEEEDRPIVKPEPVEAQLPGGFQNIRFHRWITQRYQQTKCTNLLPS